MEIDEKKKNEILYHAERTMYMTSLLIDLCDTWMPAEEANERLIQEIMERNRRQKSIENGKLKIEHEIQKNKSNTYVKNVGGSRTRRTTPDAIIQKIKILLINLFTNN
jgi:hypothetical protein